MLMVVECVRDQHDVMVIAVAIGILVAGMLAFYHLLVRADESAAHRKPYWKAIAALNAGLSIWATHFVAMLGYKGALPISFDLTFTTISAIFAVIVTWIAVTLCGVGPFRSLVTGLCTAAGVCGMHYLGMAGMHVSARISYSFPPILAGIMIAFLFFAFAYHMFERLHGAVRIAVPALSAMIAVCALHFTAMSSTTFNYDPDIIGPEQSSQARLWLTVAVSGVAVLTAVVTAVAAVIERYVVDLKGFANASLEGLAIIRDRRIIETNARFVDLMGSSEIELIGAVPDDFLTVSDGRSVDLPRSLPVEATPVRLDTERVYELAVHTIEYRGRRSQVAAVRDLTEARVAQRRIDYLARYDTLTGLPNRRMFEERLALQLNAGGETFAVVALDLDRFKAVNDLYGHAEGDRILRHAAGLLSSSIRQTDMAARFDGDEFMIVTSPGTTKENVHDLARDILVAFQEKMDVDVDPTAVGVSIGVALFPHDGTDVAGIINAAELALYRAKHNGRGTLAFYDLAMDQENRTRRGLEADLRKAIARGELHLLYQPIQSVQHGVVGYEALVRWHHRLHGNISPDVFIPIAEETGAIFSIGDWVLQEACRTASGWPAHLKVAVNISPIQFRAANLVFSICSVLEQSGLPPERLELEITETALVRDRAATLDALRHLKARGVSIVMDDFGTGYSSLSNLQSFPFDKLKIDRSFIAAMDKDPNAHAIIKAVVGLGRSLNMPVTAEGIETSEQYAMIVLEGCTHAQGYLFGKPGSGPSALPVAVTYPATSK